MDVIDILFGHGRDLTTLQMCCRAIVVFVIALILIRISGRRSFGLHSPLDNIITILLGAILSRAVIGASAFAPVIASCLLIVCLHRLLGVLLARNKAFGRFLHGKRILLYENDEFILSNLKRALVNKDDVMSGLRKATLSDDLGIIDKVFMEGNGEISFINKKDE